MPKQGDTLSRFRLLERLDEGGVAQVWRAHDGDRDVAVKIFPAPHDPAMRARLDRASRLVTELGHPVFVPIESVEEADDSLLACMELVKGQTLSEFIPRRGMACEAFLRHGLALTEAIRAGHRKGIIHGSLRPEHVMITPAGDMRILGFGQVQAGEALEQGMEEDDFPTLTRSNDSTASGVFPYMAPEQIQGAPVDHHGDIFSLGVILYEMATGRHPFEGESPADTYVAILKDTPRPVTSLNPLLPARIEKAIYRSLEKDPDQRYLSVHTLHTELERIRAEYGSAESA